MAVAMIAAVCFTANAQTYKVLEDVSSKIKNADFSADAAVTNTIRTYSKDMTDNGIGAEEPGVELYGQQPLTGWTAANPTDNIKNDAGSLVSADARAAGVFEYLKEDSEDPTIGLGGNYFAPYDYECTVAGAKALGMVAVWGATLQYTQDITLPAGAYMIVIPVMNTAGTGALTKNLNGFITDAGVEYFASNKQYEVGIQMNDTIVFKLDAETSGKLSLGHQSGNGGSGTAPHLFFDKVSLYTIDPASLDAAEAAAAKVDLLAVIEDGKQLGADTKAAEAVYANENATLAEVLAAIENQKKINEDSIVDLSEFFLTNPHFNLDAVIEDGICTYEYDMEKNNVTHFGMQPITGWESKDVSDNVWSGSTTDTNPLNGRACGVFAIGSTAFMGGAEFQAPMVMSDGSSEGRVLGFLTCWSKTTQYTQSVTIPAGKYTLTISYYNQAGTDNVAKNLMGFIADDGTEYLSDVTSFKIGSWEQMKIMFTLDEATSGKFTVGYQAANVGSAKMPHFYIDGISLNYVGELDFDPSLMALQAAVSSASKVLDENFYEDYKEDLRNAIEAGANLVSSQSSDKDANKAAADEINQALAVANENIAAYAKLQSFSENELAAALAKYEDDKLMADLYANLETLADDVNMEALQDYAWDTEKINSTIASLDTMIKEAVQKVWDDTVESGKALESNLDITQLLEGLTFESANGWTSTNGNVSVEHGCGEIYDKSPFVVTRTLTDMPAGTYTITTRAFYRTSNNVDNYAEYESDKEPKAFIWAGHNKTGITNVAELAVEAEEAPANYSDAGGVFVPNNRTIGQQIFEDDSYAEVVEKSVSTVLTEAGDLNFGVMADELAPTSWVVWYSFQVAYNAVDESVLTSELEALIAEAEAKQEAVESETGINQALKNLEDACSKGTAALSGSKDDKVAAMTALTEAIAYADNGFELVNKLNSVAEQFSALYDNSDFESTDTEFAGVLDEINAGGFENNEKVESLIAALPVAWAKYAIAQKGFETATAEEPLDITAAIVNADFEWGNAEYWVCTPVDPEAPIGQNQGFQGKAEGYTNPEDGTQVLNFFEVWRNGAVLNDGIAGQQIAAALPAGFYTLEADAYAVNQTEVPEEGVQGAYLAAKNAVGTYTTSIGVDTKEAAPTHFSVDFESDGKSLTTIGLLIKGTNANWAAVDNFTLKYIGTEAPVGILSDVIDFVKSHIVAIYSVDGKKLSKLQKGINIIKMSDGQTQKLMVK